MSRRRRKSGLWQDTAQGLDTADVLLISPSPSLHNVNLISSVHAFGSVQKNSLISLTDKWVVFIKHTYISNFSSLTSWSDMLVCAINSNKITLRRPKIIFERFRHRNFYRIWKPAEDLNCCLWLQRFMNPQYCYLLIKSNNRRPRISLNLYQMASHFIQDKRSSFSRDEIHCFFIRLLLL